MTDQPQLLPELAQWAADGEYLRTDLFGHRVFCKQIGDPRAAPEKTLLLLHGFPESSFSYHKVVAGLAQRFERLVLFDFLGYGLSDKPLRGYTYSLFEQADLALQVWRRLGVRGGHLLAHDMGDSVATELIARHVGAGLPAWLSAGLRSFTFTNGNMALHLAALRLGQRALLGPLGPVLSRLATRANFVQTLRSAQGNDGLSGRDVELMWQGNQLLDGQRRMHRVIQYLKERMRFEQTRWLPSLRLVQEPVHICWGDADAVSPVRVAHYLKQEVCPEATLSLLPGVGHFCQLTDPQPWLRAIGAFYAART